MRNLLWQSDAWDEYIEIQPDKKLLRKVNRLLKDIIFSGYSSVRIDQKNRIVFAADEMTVIIIQCGGHYHDT